MPKTRDSAIKKVGRRLAAFRSGGFTKVKRTLRELALGSRAYMPKKKRKTKEKKPFKSVRTSDVEKSLSRAGLSASDIARLRGKK